MPHLPVTFQSGENLLHGTLDIVNEKAPWVIFLPGITGGALSPRFDYLSHAFNKAQFNFFRFNFSGQEDTMSVNNSSIEEEIRDLKYAIAFLDSRGVQLEKFGIVAKSFGAIKLFLIDDIRLQCVGLLGPAVYFGAPPTIDTMRTQRYGDIESISNIVLDESILTTWKIPTIIFHGDMDTTVNMKNSEYIYEHLTTKKELLLIPGAGHSLDNNEQEKDIVVRSLITFFKENFPNQ